MDRDERTRWLTTRDRTARSAIRRGRVPGHVDRRRDETPTPGPTGVHDAGAPDAEVQQLLQKYQDIIRTGRSLKMDMAADNLADWLNGSISEKEIPASWLINFSEVTDAIQTNNERFENSFAKKAAAIDDAKAESFQDYWEKTTTAWATNELYYASGNFTVTSRGKFQLSRKGDTVSISGTVEHHWWDPYDWHAGLAAFVPGFGSVSDEDALKLEAAGYGKSYGMFCFFMQESRGTFDVSQKTLKYRFGEILYGRAPGETAGTWPLAHDAMRDADGNVLPGARQPK